MVLRATAAGTNGTTWATSQYVDTGNRYTSGGTATFTLPTTSQTIPGMNQTNTAGASFVLNLAAASALALQPSKPPSPTHLDHQSHHPHRPPSPLNNNQPALNPTLVKVLHHLSGPPQRQAKWVMARNRCWANDPKAPSNPN